MEKRRWQRMEEERRALLCRLEEAGGSLEHILVLLVAISLSYRATAIQRDGLCRILAGEEEALPDVFPIRLGSSLMAVMALAFFFALSVKGWEESREGSCRERRSGELNAWAALLVLCAALIRLYDLTQVQQRR